MNNPVTDRISTKPSEPALGFARFIRLKKSHFVVFLACLILVWIFQGRYLPAHVLILFLLIHTCYYLFYLEFPRQYWLVAALSLMTAIWIWLDQSWLFFWIYAGLALLECCRVLVMALLKYPSTIESLKLLTEELEARVRDRTAELRVANDRLEKANKELRELDKMKTAFVSQASHDLRTPLTAIKGSLDNLAVGVAGELNEKQRRILDRATRSVDRLTALINDVLDLSRIESGRITLEKTDTPMSSLVKRISLENQPAAQQKRIALNVSLPANEILIQADMGKLERVVSELVSNAIKYTREEGSVGLSLANENGQAVLCVTDTGIGMSKEDCTKIWERFYRTRESQTFAKGSGLGLSIAKELVEMHGGTLTVESEQDQGATFTLKLPLREKERAS